MNLELCVLITLSGSFPHVVNLNFSHNSPMALLTDLVAIPVGLTCTICSAVTQSYTLLA